MLEEYGLKVVRLDLPFRLNHVNCFIGEGPDGTQIIDAGLHNENTIERWETELKGRQVTDILITHYHPDHFGYAGALQRRTGARVSMSRTDEGIGKKAWEEDSLDSLKENYALAGIPSDSAAAMIENTREFIPRVKPYPKVDHFFEEGESVQIGKLAYEVLFTPGHSNGLVSLYNAEKSLLLSADHILPRITPNISYWFHGDPNPLKSYMESLERVKDLEVQLVIPSHGSPFYGANGRIEEILSHHHVRLEELLLSIKDGSTVMEASETLFRRKLTIHEFRFAIGETLAHLEYLRLGGKCRREISNGAYVYML